MWHTRRWKGDVDAEVALEGGHVDGPPVDEEDEPGPHYHQQDQEHAQPDEAAGAALEQQHEDDGDHDSHNKGQDEPSPVLSEGGSTFWMSIMRLASPAWRRKLL